jgi:hypothetical protein
MSSRSRSRTRPVSPPRACRSSHAPHKRRDEYCRERDLPRLVPVLAADLDTPTPQEQQALLALLRRALRAERRRARAGDWSYDLRRHAALLAAYRHELELWQEARKAQSLRRA